MRKDLIKTLLTDKRKSAFTLAEVLITLGIIGVVAALTLPTLIQNYQKKLVATRLAHFSSMLQQGVSMRMSQSIDGTFVDLGPSEVRAFNPDDMLNFVERYWKPYIKFSKIEKESRGVLAGLANGSGVYFVKECVSNTSVGTCTYIFFCPEYKYCKNLNKNTYAEKFDDRKTIFRFWIDGSIARYKEVKDKTREEVLEECKNAPYICGALIQRDGWEIKDDYPW